MGIRFLDSILMLLTASAGVGAAYFAGHALSLDHDAGWAWLTAAGLVVAAVFLGAITSRRVRGYAQKKGEDLTV